MSKLPRVVKSMSRAALLLGLTLPAAGIHALEIRPSAALSFIWTDNRDLAPQGDEESDIITYLSPAVVVSSQGSRYDFSTRYRLDLLHYADADDSTSVYNDLDSRLDLRLIGDNLLLFSRAKVTQVLKEPRERVTFDNLPVTNNRSNVTILETRPEWRQSVLGNSFRTSYTLGMAEYGDGGLRDYKYRFFDTQLQSPEIERGLGWSLLHEYRRYEYDDVPDFRRQLAQAQLFWELGSGWAPFATWGLESDFRDRTGTSLEDSLWNVGLRRNTDRSRFQVSYGERSFGSTFSALVEQQYGADSADIIRLSYTESPSVNEEQFREESGLAELVDLEGVDGPILPPGISRPGTGNAFIAKRARFTVRRQLNKNRLGLVAFYEEDERISQDISGTLSNEKQFGGSVLWDYQLGVRTSASVSLLMAREEFAATTSESADDLRLLRFRAQLSYEIGRRTQASLWVARLDRRGSDLASRNYEENQVGLSLNRNFF